MKNFVPFILYPFVTSFTLTYLSSLLLISKVSKMVSKPKPELEGFHPNKEKIPNIGGISFVISTIITTFIFAPISTQSIYLLTVVLSFSLLGFVDDYYKQWSENGDGIKSGTKMFWQFSLAIIFILYGTNNNYISSGIPFLMGESALAKIFENGLLIFLMVYFVNGFNITDGLDGLVGYVSLPLCVLLILVALILPNNQLTLVLSTSIFAGLLAFLKFNKYPAKYFMGDCGSMSLGVILFLIAITLNITIIFFIASLMVSIELVSSFIQIVAIRIFNKKVFSIAPIHHMFEKKGDSETKIVYQFTRISTLFSIVALMVFCAFNC